jgi:hypothetical protein
MAVTIRSTDVTTSVFCKAGEHTVAIRPIDLDALNRADRVVLRSLTGQWRDGGSTYVPGEFIIPECAQCRADFRTSSLALALARIRTHVAAMMRRGVAQDDAIRYAVERQITLSEIKLSPAFVALVHGMDPAEFDLVVAPAADPTAHTCEPVERGTLTSERTDFEAWPYFRCECGARWVQPPHCDWVRLERDT